MKPYTGPILKPDRDYDPILDGDDDDFDDEIKATPDFPPPLPAAEFNRIADELQHAADLAQSKMRICTEPEFSRLVGDVKKARDALHDHYKNRAFDVLFADAERQETFRLKQLEDKEDATRESARLRQQASRERRR